MQVDVTSFSYLSSNLIYFLFNVFISIYNCSNQFQLTSTTSFEQWTGRVKVASMDQLSSHPCFRDYTTQ